jgi:exodeoxyribonuclease VII small subunit
MATEKFETSLKKLEEIVHRLEGGSLSLEDSLKAFEEGVKHSSFCAKKLDEAERRVEVLLKRKDGTFAREPFEAEDD